MKFLTPQGKIRNINISPYLANWEEGCLSEFQKRVKDFFRPYWQHHIVLEEFTLPNSGKLRLDLYNVTRNIACETQGNFHQAYSKFFHSNNRLNFANQIKKDLRKAQILELNKIKLIEIFEDEEKLLSKEWIEEKFGISL